MAGMLFIWEWLVDFQSVGTACVINFLFDVVLVFVLGGAVRRAARVHHSIHRCVSTMRAANARLRAEVKRLVKLEKEWCQRDGYPVENSDRCQVAAERAKLNLEPDVRRNPCFLKGLLDLIPSPVFYLDKEGRYRYCNHAHAREILGVRTDETAGKTIAELTPGISPELHLLHQKHHQELLVNGGVLQCEMPVLCADGVRRHFLATKSVFLGANGRPEGIITWLLDITERRRMERSFACHQRRLIQAMNVAQLAYWQHDETKKIFTFDDRFFALCGTTVEREGGYLMSTDTFFRNFLLPDEVELVRSAITTASNSFGQQDVFECEHRLRRRDGRTSHVVMRATLERDARGHVIGANGTIQDITLRRQAEDDLNKLWMAVEQSPVSVVITDVSGRVEYVNRQFVETTGLSASEIAGQIPPVFNPERYEGAVLQRLWDTLKGGQAWRGELGSRKRDGTLMQESVLISPVRDSMGKIAHFISVQEDITLRRQVADDLRRADDVLRQQTALLRSMASSTPFSYYVSDARTDKVLYFNRRFVEIWGLDEIQDALDHSKIPHTEVLARLVASVADVKEFDRHRQCLADLEVGSVVEGDIPLKNGRILHHLAVKILDEDGRFLGRLSVFEDVTNQKQAAQRLSASLNQKEVLLREVYHRVKNNLQVISSLLNLQSVSIRDPETLGLFRDTQDRVRSMALVHEKLYRANDLCKIDFADYAQQLVAMLARSYQTQGCRVNLRFNLQKISLNLDTSIPCGLILNELVSNALKYAFKGMPGGEPPELRVKLEMAGPGTYLLVVADNGVGLPAEVDVFNTATLGLQVVTMLTEQLSGTIEVDRSHGASFKLIFREIRDVLPNRPVGGLEASSNPMVSKAWTT
jgi:PAS domain S-box-containing protein